MLRPSLLRFRSCLGISITAGVSAVHLAATGTLSQTASQLRSLFHRSQGCQTGRSFATSLRSATATSTLAKARARNHKATKSGKKEAASPSGTSIGTTKGQSWKYVRPHNLMDGRPRADRRKKAPAASASGEGFHNGFMNLGVPHHLVKRLGFENPSSVQTRAIPLLLQKWNQQEGRYDRVSNSVVIHSSNGSGKTLAYMLPMYTRIDKNLAGIQGVVVSPTDTLARQINVQANKIVEPSKTLIDAEERDIIHPLFWLQPAGPRLDEQSNPPLAVLGTFDYLPRALEGEDLSQVKYVVIDEADYVLSRATPGFDEFLQRLAAVADPVFVFVTATASVQVLGLAERLATHSQPAVYVSNRQVCPAKEVRAAVADQNTLYPSMAKTVQHNTVSFAAPPGGREEILARMQLLKHLVGTLLGQPSYKPGQTILVFHHDLKLFSQYGVEDLLRRAWNCTVTTLHDHASRSEIGRAFRLTRHIAAGADVILCNDVVSRGVDLKGVTHVINFGVPQNKAQYVHRAGRVGRLGGFSASVTTVWLRGNTLHPQSGSVITLVNQGNPEELTTLGKHVHGLGLKLSPFKATPVKLKERRESSPAGSKQ